MGRRKIEIQPITHDRNRSVTFLKRKNGLFKKAYELGVLCSVDVCVVIFGHNGKLHEYCSGDSSAILDRRIKFSGDKDLRRPTDFGGSKATAGDDDDDDDQPDSADEPPPPASKSSKSVHDSRAKNNKSTRLSSTTPSYPPSSHNIADLVRGDYRDQNGHAESGTGLPPSNHPLNIASGHNSPFSQQPTAQSFPASLSHHHQQLAHQFLVQQLQNINPNMNTLQHPPPPASRSHSSQDRHISSFNMDSEDRSRPTQPSYSLPPVPNTQSQRVSSMGSSDSIPNEFLSMLTSGAGSNSAASSLFDNFPHSNGHGGTASLGLEWPKTNPARQLGSQASSSASSIPHGGGDSPSQTLERALGGTSDASHPQHGLNKSNDSSTWLEILTSLGVNPGDKSSGSSSDTARPTEVPPAAYDNTTRSDLANDVLFMWDTPSTENQRHTAQPPPLPPIASFSSRRDSGSSPGAGQHSPPAITHKRRRSDESVDDGSRGPSGSPVLVQRAGSGGAGSGRGSLQGSDVSGDELGHKRRRER